MCIFCTFQVTPRSSPGHLSVIVPSFPLLGEFDTYRISLRHSATDTYISERQYIHILACSLSAWLRLPFRLRPCLSVISSRSVPIPVPLIYISLPVPVPVSSLFQRHFIPFRSRPRSPYIYILACSRSRPVPVSFIIHSIPFHYPFQSYIYPCCI